MLSLYLRLSNALVSNNVRVLSGNGLELLDSEIGHAGFSVALKDLRLAVGVLTDEVLKTCLCLDECLNDQQRMTRILKGVPS